MNDAIILSIVGHIRLALSELDAANATAKNLDPGYPGDNLRSGLDFSIGFLQGVLESLRRQQTT